MHSFIWSC